MTDAIPGSMGSSATWFTDRASVPAQTGAMEIEILHIADCPNWREAGARVAAALRDLRAQDVPVRFTLLTTPDEAGRVAFAGSPTILVDGFDAFPSDGLTKDLACRIYRVGGRFAGTPSLADLRGVLAERMTSRSE